MPVLDESRLERLTGRIYDAALDASQWQGVIDGFAALQPHRAARGKKVT
jgi:hypothetical protein